MKNLIDTRAALNTRSDEEELSEIEAIRLRAEGKEESPEVWGKCMFLLSDVSAVLEHWPDDRGPEENTCNIVFKNGKTWGIQIPYEEMRALVREYHGDDKPTRTLDVADAVDILCKALAEDKKEGSLYYGYQSNIAMAFVQAFDRSKYAGVHPTDEDAYIHLVANQAAKNFLDLLIKSVD